MAELKIQEITLHYETYGEGEPILFIHGLGSSTRDWELQVSEFSRDYQVVLFDVRGHGKSDKPPGPYSIPLFAKDAAGLLGKLEISPAHIVGISMGGMIGLQLAVDRPELVRSLVVINCGSELVIKNMKDRIQVWQRLLIPRIFGMRKMGQVLGDRLFPKPEQEEIRAIFIDHWRENDVRAYNQAFKALVGWSVTDKLETIECPVLVVAADEDYTSVESKENYVQKIKNGKLIVVKDSRHPTPVDQPEIFNQVLRDFLEKVN
jgi:3-oxoadipate enol-lactonase